MSIWLKISLVLNLLGAGQGLFLSLLFFSKKNGNQLSNRILGFLLLAFVFPIVNTLRVLAGYGIKYELFEFYSNISLLTVGPLIYLYIRVITQKDFSWNDTQWRHFIPYFLFLFYVLIYSGVSFFQIDLLHKIDKWWLFMEPIIFIFLNLQMIYYFYHSYTLINKYHILYKPVAKLRLNWLKSILTGYVIIWGINLLILAFIAALSIPDYIYLNVTLLMALHVFYIAYKAWNQPGISEVLDQRKKYEGSKLEKERRLEILKEIQEGIQKENAFLDSNLTVKMLAKILDLPERHISQVINQELEQNFQDFINYYRIEEVKRRLASPDYYHLTLMGIANETGFKSSSTFNQAFKKHTGLLPSVYRKSLQKD